MATHNTTHNGELSSHISQLQDSARRVGDEIGKAGRVAKEAAEEQVAELSKAGEEQLQKVVELVKERPITSMLIGGVLGFCLAKMMKA